MEAVKPLVSIIIVNWNGGNVFKNCLSSLAKISYPNWELVLVDNGSSDESEKLPENFGIKPKSIFNKTNLGFAKANNQGVKKASGKYILLLNNDTKVPKDFLSILVERIESDVSVGVIQPKIFMMDKAGYLDNTGSFITRIGFFEHWGFGQRDTKEFEIEREIMSAKGACMLIRRDVIDKIGLFDQDFFSYFEETDFCWRVWLSGFKVIFYPKTFIYHKVGFTIKRLDVQNINFHYYKNRICSFIKNLETINLVKILAYHLIVSLGIAFAFLARGQIKNSLMVIRAIFWNVANLSKTLGKRREIQKIRKISDGKLFAKFMRKVNWKRFYNDFRRVEKDIKR